MNGCLDEVGEYRREARVKMRLAISENSDRL